MVTLSVGRCVIIQGLTYEAQNSGATKHVPL
jgi:hypothetical protein